MASAGARVSGGALAAVVLVVVLIGGVVAVFALAEGVADDEPPAERVQSGRVTDEDYAAVQVGMDKEQVEQLLLPARAVDVAVLDRYELREPATPSASCAYYESEGGTADDLYRFCYDEDQLVEKTVVLPREDGVTGGT